MNEIIRSKVCVPCVGNKEKGTLRMTINKTGLRGNMKHVLLERCNDGVVT